MKLNELRENPNNPSVATETEIDRLAGKLKRVPLGLTAMRIAYVRDEFIITANVSDGEGHVHSKQPSRLKIQNTRIKKK